MNLEITVNLLPKITSTNNKLLINILFSKLKFFYDILS